MQNVFYNISQVLGITIIHSLWQGLFIYALLRLLLMLTRAQASSTRYFLSLSSLAVISCWFLFTLMNQIHFYNWDVVTPQKLPATTVNDLPVALTQFKSESISYYNSIEKYLPYITLCYLAGLLFNTIKLIAGRKGINRIKQTMSIDTMLQRQVDNFTGMLNIDQKVRIGLSKMVNVPCMMGYVKPIILLPFALPNYLNISEIEAIILHELAHIKRNDYLVNLVQQIVSAILFFNPCALLINRIVNEERENCCDDLVLMSTPDPKTYANALFKLEQMRENNMRMAIAATGKKYHLLNRIERIMKTKKQIQSIRPALLALLLLALTIGGIAFSNPEIAKGEISVKTIRTALKNITIADTAHKKINKTHHALTSKRATYLKVRDHDYLDFGEKYYNGYNDSKLEKLSAEISAYSDEIEKYFDNSEFKKLQQQIEVKGKDIDRFYSNPELQQLLRKQQKYSDDFAKNFVETPEIKQLNRKMEESGKKIGEYYNSAEFKAMKASVEKKYGLHDQIFNTGDTLHASARYKKFVAEIYNKLPVAVKSDQDAISRISKQMMSRYNDPATRELNEKFLSANDSLKEAYANGEIKQQQMAMNKLIEKMNAYQNNKTIKSSQRHLNNLVKKMQDYTNSPEFKKKIETYRKIYSGGNWQYNSQPESPERPESPEKPEAPETKEAPEGNNQ